MKLIILIFFHCNEPFICRVQGWMDSHVCVAHLPIFAVSDGFRGPRPMVEILIVFLLEYAVSTSS